MTSSLIYHKSTCYERHKLDGHFLDWDNRPSIYKSYSPLTTVDFPKPGGFQPCNLWALEKDSMTASGILDFKGLAEILDLSYCHTARAKHPDGDFYYRSVASAGALYPIEIYAAVYSVSGLVPGVYHYNLKNRQLVLLREGTYHREIMNASWDETIKNAAVTFFITGIFFRSAWKYRDRAYRYILLDAGHLLQNLLLALSSKKIPFSFVFDFMDQAINKILDLDQAREACLAWVHFGTAMDDSHTSAPIDLQDISVEPLTEEDETHRHAIIYDSIRDIHRAGIIEALPSPRAGAIRLTTAQTATSWHEIPKFEKIKNELNYPEAVFLRRSKRNFKDHPLDFPRFARLLDVLSLSLNPTENYLSAVDVGFLANSIEGLKPGFYLYDDGRRKVGLVEEGVQGPVMAHVCLDQQWLRHAAVHFLFMCNFKKIDSVWGPRGYRYAMMTAGKMGQLIYVGATALGLGCCGIGALYDGEAQELLGLDRDCFVAYLVAVGPVKSV
jgi:SagB-type dehydrogenase family enzyme